jgi:hypothetical protein
MPQPASSLWSTKSEVSLRKSPSKPSHSVDADPSTSYYFLNYSPGETTITAFPSGFDMIAGDSNQRNFTLPVPDPEKSLWSSDPAQSSQFGLMQKAVGFNCLNYDIAPEGSLYRHFMPDKAYLDANCKDGVRAELMFPSCWNGKDLTSTNKRSHVAYPDLVMTGSCPPDFPVRLPGLFYEIIWDTHAFAGTDGEFIWSNGDPTGHGFHGDFVMGWPNGTLQSAVDTCTSSSGRIEDCPLFTLQSEAESKQCLINVPGILASEDLSGPIDGLPGGVKINYGPAYVVPGAAAPSSAAAIPIPTLSHSAGSTVAPSGTALPGGVFVEGSVAQVPAASVPAQAAAVVKPHTTAAPVVPSVPLQENQKPYATIYSTVGNEVIEIVMIDEYVTVTGSPVTMTEYVTVPGRRKRHLHRHAAGKA